MQEVNIYIETNIRPPRKGDIWYGYVLEYIVNGEPYTKGGFARIENTTPNRAVLEACVEAVARVKRPCKITIHTDNLYVATGIRDRMDWWAKDNWLNAKKQEISHCTLWQKLYYELSIHEKAVGSSQEYSKWLLSEIERREYERINVSKDADEEEKEEA